MRDQPTNEAALDALFAALECSPRALLMLDYDGTLAPFRNDPADAVPYPGVTELLDSIMQGARTRVVLISGRRAMDVLGLLKTHVRPEVWGCHGWERLEPSGTLSIQPAPPLALEALIAASGVADCALRLGARLERKPSSLALHWRGLAEERA